MSSSSPQPIVELRRVSKAYGHVQAVEDVDFAIYPEEVVALVGDNGAGKSTLMKILAGAIQPSAGQIIVDGIPAEFRDPKQAQSAGIATVYQNLALVEVRSVAHNIFLGDLPKKGLFVDYSKMVRDSEALLADLGIQIPSVQQELRLLSGGQRQSVAIARAIRKGGRIIMMDEPTAALGTQEQVRVLTLIGELRNSGRGVFVVSHNLDHVFSVADRIVVLRHGRVVGTRSASVADPDEIVGLITGSRQRA